MNTKPLVDQLRELANREGLSADAAAAYFHASLIVRDYSPAPLHKKSGEVTRKPWTEEEIRRITGLPWEDLPAFATACGRSVSACRTKWTRVNGPRHNPEV